MENSKTNSAAEVIKQFRAIAGVAIGVLIIGMVFYHYVEHWSWLNSIYFCVITLTTVGYGDFTPHTDIGKLFTIFYVLTGIGILAAFANNLLKSRMAKRFLRKNAKLDTENLDTGRITSTKD